MSRSRQAGEESFKFEPALEHNRNIGVSWAEMPDQSEADYFADRALVEQDLSRTAGDPKAAAAHAELAERYEALAEVFKSDHPTLKVAYQLATKRPAPIERSGRARVSE